MTNPKPKPKREWEKPNKPTKGKVKKLNVSYFFQKIGNTVYRWMKIGAGDWEAEPTPHKHIPFVEFSGGLNCESDWIKPKVASKNVKFNTKGELIKSK